MKVILYMTTTINGYIATENHDTPWSDDAWKSYTNKVREIKNMIIGRRTYELMEECNEFEHIGNPYTVVVTKKKDPKKKNTIFVASPEEALNILREKKCSQVLVGGGSILNASFMKKKLIDEIFIDIEPIAFGKGIPLFAQNNFQTKLKLLGTKQLSENTVQLHYLVEKYSTQ